MNLSQEKKRTPLSVSRRRYAQINGKKKRGAFLEEFCAVTGLSRKHAIATLNLRPPSRTTRRRGAPKKTLMTAVNFFTRIWKLAGEPCGGKLLHPILDDYLASLRKRGRVDGALAKEILDMSASTLDRRLRHVKPKTGGGRRRADSLTEHRRKIGLKTDVWPADAAQIPGWLENDTVAHCGGTMRGSFVWALCNTDVTTQWTGAQPAWNKDTRNVTAAFEATLAAMPFPALGVNTDNGPEFLNAHLALAFPELCPGAARSRSRAYVKNDNAHIEQKNGHSIRRVPGHGRIGREDALPVLCELPATESLLRNLFRATFKLLGKHREGTRWIQRLEPIPKTPAQRVPENPRTSAETKARVQTLLDSNDPITLRQLADRLMSSLVRLLATPVPPPVPAPPPSTLRRVK